MLEGVNAADLIGAVAAVIAATAAVWTVAHTALAQRSAQRRQLARRLNVRTTRLKANALQFEAHWTPDELGQMCQLEVDLLAPRDARLQLVPLWEPLEPGRPYRGHKPYVLTAPDASHRQVASFRHWRNTREDTWSASVVIVAPPDGAIDAARVRFRISTESPRKVLIARTMAISPID